MAWVGHTCVRAGGVGLWAQVSEGACRCLQMGERACPWDVLAAACLIVRVRVWALAGPYALGSASGRVVAPTVAAGGVARCARGA